MISLQEINPRQIRALLLLLVLAPMIPTGLLLRFMFETVQQERQVATQTLSDAYQNTLSIALRTVAQDLNKSETFPNGAKSKEQTVFEALQRYFEPEVKVRIVDAEHLVLADSPGISGFPIVTLSAGDLLPGSIIHLFLANQSFTQAAVKDQVDSYIRTAVITITANMLIAFVAGWAFLRQLKHQELKSSTLATLAHELRTPVASMRLLLDTIREGRCPNGSEYLELISRENMRLSRLIDQFLTHSRLELGADVFVPESISFPNIVAQVEENFGPRLHEANIKYHSELAPDLPNIFGDVASLTCMLDNLLENAWKYTGSNKDIALLVSEKNDGIEIAVRDNGIGIAPAEQLAIFDRFHQTDNRLARTAEGCGLGLNIVKRIVETHHGRIRVESQLGKGSTFIVWLPKKLRADG